MTSKIDITPVYIGTFLEQLSNAVQVRYDLFCVKSAVKPSCSVQLSCYRRQLQTCIGNSWEKTLFTYFLLHVCRKLQHETCRYSVDIYVNFVQK